MEPGPVARAAGHRWVVLDAVGSTNTEALERANRGDTGPFWVLAARQTAGRGRRGRTWVSPVGNLYATLLLHDPAPPARTPELCFVTAVAVASSLDTLGLGARVGLKWPNDVLVDGRKVAGLLIEGQSRPGHQVVAIGIGVNCLHRPLETPYPATSLAEAGRPTAPSELFAVLSDAMTRFLAIWAAGEGFAAIRQAWLARAVGLGGPVTVRLPDAELEGEFEGLDDEGHLVLRQGGTRRVIAAGDVFPIGSRTGAEA